MARSDAEALLERELEKQLSPAKGAHEHHQHRHSLAASAVHAAHAAPPPAEDTYEDSSSAGGSADEGKPRELHIQVPPRVAATVDLLASADQGADPGVSRGEGGYSGGDSSDSDYGEGLQELDEEALAELLAEEFVYDPLNPLYTAEGYSEKEEKEDEEDGEEEDPMYLEHLDHGGLYVNFEFSHFVYRSVADTCPMQLDPIFLDRTRDLGQAKIDGFVARGVNHLLEPHLPTKQVEYAWRDCQLTMNNVQDKPLGRMRCFSYQTTSNNVDVALLASAKRELATAAHVASGKDGAPTHPNSNLAQQYDDEPPAATAASASETTTANVRVSGVAKDASAYTADRYDGNALSVLTPGSTRSSSTAATRRGGRRGKRGEGGDGSEGGRDSRRRGKDKHRNRHRERDENRDCNERDSESGGVQARDVRRLDDIRLKMKSLEVGLTENAAIGHQLDVFVRQVGLFFQGLKDPEFEEGAEGAQPQMHMDTGLRGQEQAGLAAEFGSASAPGNPSTGLHSRGTEAYSVGSAQSPRKGLLRTPRALYVSLLCIYVYVCLCLCRWFSLSL